MKGLLSNFDDTLREYEQDRGKSEPPEQIDEPKDDLDDLIRDRQNTRRDSTKVGFLSSLIQKPFTDDIVEEVEKGVESEESQKEEITEEQLEDDFADFDYVAPKPPTSVKFPVETAPEIPEQDIPDLLPDLIKKTGGNRMSSRRSSYLDSLASKNQDTLNRVTKEQNSILGAGSFGSRGVDSIIKNPAPSFENWLRSEPTRHSENSPQPEAFDVFALPIEGRSRTVNTISANILTNRIPVEHVENKDLQKFNDSYAVDRMATNVLKTTLKGPRHSMADSRAIVAEIYSDITESEEDDQTSPEKSTISTSAKSPIKRQKTKIKAKFGSSTNNLRNKIKEDSKLGSLFLSRPIKEFTEFDKDYKQEINKIKEAKGNLVLDVDLIKEFSEQGCNSEIQIRALRQNFYHFIESNYGKLTCIAAEHNLEYVITGTERGLVVLWDKTLQEKFQVIQLTTVRDDHPSAMFYDAGIDAVCVGMSKGDMHYYKLEKSERLLRKRNVCKNFCPSEILIVRAFKQLSHVMAVDSEYRIFYSRIDRTKQFQKLKLEANQVGITKRISIPHMSAMPLTATSALVAVSAATEIQIFEVRDHINLRTGETYVTKLSVFNLEIPKWMMDKEANMTNESQAEMNLFHCGSSNTLEGENKKSSSRRASLDEQFDRGHNSDSHSSEDIDQDHNHSYVVFTGLKDEVNKPFVLCVAYQTTIFIYELLFLEGSLIELKKLTEIRIQARALQFTSFVGGLMLLFDIYGDFYVVDEINSILSSQNTNGHRKSRINSRNRKLRDYIARANACFKDGIPGDSSPEGDQVQYDVENVFLVYDHSKDHLAYYKTKDKSLTNYTNMIQALGNLGIVFVDQKGLYIFEIMDWKAYLEDCFKHHNYYMILRVINEILDGENDRLRRAPPRGKREEQLAPMLQKVMHDVMPFIRIEPESDIERLTNYCMMTIYKCGLTEFMLKGYEQIMAENNLYNYYSHALVLMYQSQLLPHSNIDKIFTLINYLEKHDPEENKRFVLYLFSKKLYQDQLMNTMTRGRYRNLLFYTSDKVDLPSKAMFSLEYLKQNVISQATNKDEKRQDIYRIFWFVCEHVVAKLEKNEVHYQDPTWYIINWMFKAENFLPILKIDHQAYLQGLGMLLNLGISNSLKQNSHLRLIEGNAPIHNKIMDEIHSVPEMVYMFSHIYEELSQNPRKLDLFYLYLAVLKFVKTPGVELNEEYLKKLVFGLINNVNDIVADLKLAGVDLTHENVNILIFATFTEHKEIFVDNQELKELIYKNE